MHDYSFGFVCFSSCMFFFNLWGFLGVFFGGGSMGKGVHTVSSLSVPLVSIPVN